MYRVPQKTYIILIITIIWITLVGFIGPAYVHFSEESSLGKHRIITEALQYNIGLGNPTPPDVCGLKKLKYVGASGRQEFKIDTTVESLHELKYYPDAWNKPGKILLQSSVLGLYVITFGDGSRAIVREWIPKIEGNYDFYDLRAKADSEVLILICILLFPVMILLLVSIKGIIKTNAK